MTKLVPISFFTAALITFSSQIYSQDTTSEAEKLAEVTACVLPGAPIIPDGNVASEDELISAQKAMKGFQKSLLTFRECIQTQEKAIDQESEDAEKQGRALLDQFNGSVDAEENLASEFNTAVKAFKARQQ